MSVEMGIWNFYFLGNKESLLTVQNKPIFFSVVDGWRLAD